MVTLYVLPIVLLVAACALLLVGFRGRRVDDHPLCRWCGFDLVGIPASSGACSECGADLRADRAIRTGHRARRAGMIALSLVLLVPSLLWIGVVGYAAATDVEWIACKPVWWLLRDANMDRASMSELLKRLGTKKLSASEIDQVVAEALSFQVNASATWNPGWGEFVEQARLKGSVAEPQWARYLKQSVMLGMRARPVIARGDPVWVEVMLKELRLGNTWKPDIFGVETSRRIDGRQCASAAVGGFTFRAKDSGQQASGSLLRPDEKVIAALAAGTKKLSVTYEVEMSRFNGQTTPATQQQLDATFELRESPPATVSVESDEAARRDITERAFRNRPPSATYFNSGDAVLTLIISAPAAYDLAYDVSVRLPDGAERKLSSIAVRRGSTQAARCIGSIGRLAPDAKTIDVILRPSVDVALQTFNLDRLCAGEIRMDAIPLRRQDNEARPSVNEERERIGNSPKR